MGAVFFLVFYIEKWGVEKRAYFLGAASTLFFQGFSRRFLLFFGGGGVFVDVFASVVRTNILDVFAAVL